jgi:hypothetical protein
VKEVCVLKKICCKANLTKRPKCHREKNPIHKPSLEVENIFWNMSSRDKEAMGIHLSGTVLAYYASRPEFLPRTKRNREEWGGGKQTNRQADRQKQIDRPSLIWNMNSSNILEKPWREE